MRVLVVEDELKIARTVGVALEGEGFSVVLSANGEDAFYRASTGAFDAIVLDRMLPGRDGVEVLGALRSAGCRTPVLMLTALGAVEDRVEGLTAGADDYLVKPFAMTELVARLRALIRRGTASAEVEVTAGDVRLHLLSRRATVKGQAIPLTQMEWELLLLLARSAGAVVSRDAISNQLWPDQSRNASLDNLIDVHVGRLRKKLSSVESGAEIQAIRGLGFLLRDGACHR